jgi:hypothetical protein
MASLPPYSTFRTDSKVSAPQVSGFERVESFVFHQKARFCENKTRKVDFLACQSSNQDSVKSTSMSYFFLSIFRKNIVETYEKMLSFLHWKHHLMKRQ